MAFNSTIQERYYTTPPEEVYKAVKYYLTQHGEDAGFKIKSIDDRSLSCDFTSSVSMTTWGEALSASVIPSGHGSMVRLTVAGKVGGTAVFFQGQHNIRIASKFFQGVSTALSYPETTVTSMVGQTITRPAKSQQVPTLTVVEEVAINPCERLFQWWNKLDSEKRGSIVVATIVSAILILFVVVGIAASNAQQNAKHEQIQAMATADLGHTEDSSDIEPVPEPSDDISPSSAASEEPAVEESNGISSVLECTVDQTQDEYDFVSSAYEKYEGVTIENYTQKAWQSGKFLNCGRGGSDAAYGTPSEEEQKAAKVAYDINWDSAESEQDFRNHVVSLYGICASTSSLTWSEQHTLSDGQANEIEGALMLCPSHPRADYIKQKLDRDRSTVKEAREKREQGLIKDDGTYSVPNEFAYGIWRTRGEKITNCYWETRDGAGNILENNFINGGAGAQVNIYEGVASFHSTGCGAWEKIQ